MKILKEYINKRALKNIVRQKNKQISLLQQTYDKKVARMEFVYEATVKDHISELNSLMDKHKKEMLKIREQVSREYKIIIEELEQEIQRLNSFIKDKKDFYEALKERSRRLDEVSTRVEGLFQTGINMITDGMGYIHKGRASIEHSNEKIKKLENKS